MRGSALQRGPWLSLRSTTILRLIKRQKICKNGHHPCMKQMMRDTHYHPQLTLSWGTNSIYCWSSYLQPTTDIQFEENILKRPWIVHRQAGQLRTVLPQDVPLRDEIPVSRRTKVVNIDPPSNWLKSVQLCSESSEWMQIPYCPIEHPFLLRVRALVHSNLSIFDVLVGDVPTPHASEQGRRISRCVGHDSRPNSWTRLRWKHGFQAYFIISFLGEVSA